MNARGYRGLRYFLLQTHYSHLYAQNSLTILGVAVGEDLKAQDPHTLLVAEGPTL